MENGVVVDNVERDEHFSIPQIVYICAAIEILTTLGGSICGVPYIRLIEDAVCQRFYHVGTFMAEDLCKGDAVQSEMAYLMGAMSSFASLPTLLLILPYGILAEHVDRRFILLVNFLSTIISILYVIAISYYPGTDLKLLWLSGLFDIAGGGSSVSTVLVRSMMAESAPSSALSTLFYRLSGINMIIRLFGTSFGSWLLHNGAASTMLVGTCVWGLTIPLLTFLPAPSPKHPSPDSKYMKREQSESIELPVTASRKSEANCENQRARSTPFDALVESLGSFKRLIFHSKPFVMCLSIMFLNTVALDSRSLLRPWLSKRYNWDLATTGYILSFESILGVSILFVLQFVNSRSSSTSFWQKRTQELRVAKISLICGILGSTLLGLSESRTGFILSVVVISDSVGFLDAVKAYFTAILARDSNEKADIGRLYSGIMMVDYVAMICGAPVWSAIYSLGYGLGGLFVGLPFFGGAVMMGLTLVLVWKQGLGN